MFQSIFKILKKLDNAKETSAKFDFPTSLISLNKKDKIRLFSFFLLYFIQTKNGKHSVKN